MALQHRYTLVCEDIRQENTGKWIITGLYPGSITTSQLPFLLPTLAFFLCLDADTPGQYKFRFQFTHFASGALIVPELTGIMGVPKAGAVILPIKLNNLQFRAHGSYSVSLQVEGHEPILTEFQVEIGQQPPPLRMPMPGL